MKALLYSGLILFSQLCIAGAYDQVSKDIVRLASQNQILIFGESHQLRDARYILMQVLGEGVSSGIIDGIATEYVSEEFEEDFQTYLTQPNAGVGTENEKAFFAKVSEKFIWTKDETNLQFYRYLRALKLVHPQLKICGLDVRVSNDPIVRAERFSRFPPRLLQAAEQVFGMKKEALIASEFNFDREPLMALRAVNCLQGTKHGIAHMGAFHAKSARYKSEAGWEPTSFFMSILRPSVQIPTIFTAQPMPDPSQSDHWLHVMTKKAHAIVNAKDLKRTRLVSSSSLNQEARRALVFKDEQKEISFANRWDYLILGPDGEYAPVF